MGLIINALSSAGAWLVIISEFLIVFTVARTNKKILKYVLVLAVIYLAWLKKLREELFEYIDEKLNPYPEKLDVYVYENKGYNEWTADFACEQCGKFGVSVNEDFLPVGRCCYCGWDNELEKCRRCNQLVAADTLEDGLCPSCSG